MTRRDFLRLRMGPEGAIVDLWCERFYMRFVDARLGGVTPAPFARLADRLAGARELRMHDAAWLCDRELRERLDPLLATFRQAGGRVREIQPSSLVQGVSPGD